MKIKKLPEKYRAILKTGDSIAVTDQDGATFIGTVTVSPYVATVEIVRDDVMFQLKPTEEQLWPGGTPL